MKITLNIATKHTLKNQTGKSNLKLRKEVLEELQFNRHMACETLSCPVLDWLFFLFFFFPSLSIIQIARTCRLLYDRS